MAEQRMRSGRPIVNQFTPVAGVVTGGQPDEAQLRAFAEEGVGTVLDLCGEHEPRGFDEARLAAALGMEYERLPVVASLDDAVLERLRARLREREGGTVLVHCRSGNRVGAALIPYLVLDEGMPPERALDTAVKVGLRSQALANLALRYVDLHDENGGER